MEKYKPKLLICTPEVTFDLPEGMGNLAGKVLNFKTGGMADVNSTIIRDFVKDPNFELHVALPKWESSLKELSELTENELKDIQEALHDKNYHLIKDASFNHVKIEGTNTMMYDDTHRFKCEDRAIAYNRGIINYVIPHVNPDITWCSDWMLGLVPPAAKSMGIKNLTTGHNIFTKFVGTDHVIKSGIDLRTFKDNLIYGENFDVDFLASEIFASDYFTTVSPTFLKELGSGKYNSIVPDSVMKQIQYKIDNNKAKGILNPRQEKDSQFLKCLDQYGLETVISGRQENTKKLRNKLGLKNINCPILIFPNRLFSGQKNPELPLYHAKDLAKKYNIQFIFLANGSERLEKISGEVAMGSDSMVSYSKFKSEIEDLAMRSDMVYGLMTSNYEPCGKPNIIYPGEGVLVLGHKVGGIADSVKNIDIKNNTGNGFLYDTNNLNGLESGIKNLIKFNNLDTNTRYDHLKRIANENLVNHSVEKMVNEYKDIIFQLYEERIKEME